MTPTPWLHLAPGVPALWALGGARGVSDLEPWLAPSGAGAPEAQPLAGAERLADFGFGELLRHPLPGTPDTRGRLTGAPRGAGTGHVLVWRFRVDGFAARRLALRARVTQPHSASGAERAWNLACALQRAGVGTPELLAVGALRGARTGLGSLLIARDLEGMTSLGQWLGAPAGGAEDAERIARSLGAALRRAWTAGLRGLELSPDELFVTGLGGGCGAGPGNRLPGVVLRGFVQAREGRAGTTRGVRRERERLLAGVRTAGPDGAAFARLLERELSAASTAPL